MMNFGALPSQVSTLSAVVRKLERQLEEARTTVQPSSACAPPPPPPADLEKLLANTVDRAELERALRASEHGVREEFKRDRRMLEVSLTQKCDEKTSKAIREKYSERVDGLCKRVEDQLSRVPELVREEAARVVSRELSVARTSADPTSTSTSAPVQTSEGEAGTSGPPPGRGGAQEGAATCDSGGASVDDGLEAETGTEGVRARAPSTPSARKSRRERTQQQKDAVHGDAVPFSE